MDQQPPTRIGPKDVFLHLAAVVTLYVSAASFITLLFQYINVLVPNPLAGDHYYYQGYDGPLQFAIASLLIVFPAFLVISHLLERDYRAQPAHRVSTLKRWLTYFTLFAAAAIVIGDLVTLIYNFLGGGMTLQFVLKSASFLLVAGAVFAHYLREVRASVPPAKAPC